MHIIVAESLQLNLLLDLVDHLRLLSRLVLGDQRIVRVVGCLRKPLEFYLGLR